MYHRIISVLLVMVWGLGALPSYGITINNTDINTLAKPGDMITYTDLTADHIALHFNNNNLEIGTIDFSHTHLAGVLADLEKKRLAELSAGTHLSLRCSNTTRQGMALKGGTKIAIEGNQVVNIAYSILESPFISFTSPSFKSMFCFLKGCQYVTLETINPHALFQMIEFTFPPIQKTPWLIEGDINLETGEMPIVMLVKGAQTVTIRFGTTAFTQ